MVDKEMVLRDGFAHAATAGLEAYLNYGEREKIYQEKIMACAKKRECDLSEEEVRSYIHKQMDDIDALLRKSDSPVELRFQAS